MTTTSAPAAIFNTLSIEQLARVYVACLDAAGTRVEGSLAAKRLLNRAFRAHQEALRRNFILTRGYSGTGVYEKIRPCWMGSVQSSSA